ncbi:MAG: hypothetical protein Q9209_007809 [Squamulea sp. 1 TL-2023]
MEQVKGFPTALRQWFQNLCRRIFYEEPIRIGRRHGLQYIHLATFYWYATIFGIFNWIIPLAFLLLWYIFIVHGCSSNWARRLVLDDICTGPYLTHEVQMPWYLDLWTPEAVAPGNHSEIQIPPYLEAIMVGHLKLRDTAKALMHQSLKMQQSAPGFVTGEMADDLGRVESTLMQFVPLFENFSRSFCQEKDIMNHLFRTFVNSYAAALSKSDQMKELAPSNLLIWPLWEHLLRFVNHYALIPWLPAPTLYSLQVRSEIRFQARRFVQLSIAALERVDTHFYTQQDLHNSTTLSQLLTSAFRTIDLHQHRVQESIDRVSEPSSLRRYFAQILPESEEVRALREHHARAFRIQNSIQMLNKAMSMHEENAAKLKEELHYFRSSFSHGNPFEISVHGLVAIPPILQAQIRLPVYDFIQPSWEAERRSSRLTADNHNKSTTASPIDIYRYHFNMVTTTNISSLRPAIAHLCQERWNRNMVSGSLYMICNIWNHALMISELDSEMLASVQRSWVIERLRALKRYGKEIGAEEENIASLAKEVMRKFKRGTKVPEFLE